MTEVGCITLAELDAFVEHDLCGQERTGASVVVQQPEESVERLLLRLRRSAQVLRESGCGITSAVLLLGAHDTIRLTDRLDVARGLLDLLNGEAATLHLVSTTGPGEQERLFELVGWLLAGGHRGHGIRLTFSEGRLVSCGSTEQESAADEPGSPTLGTPPRVYDLTG